MLPPRAIYVMFSIFFKKKETVQQKFTEEWPTCIRKNFWVVVLSLNGVGNIKIGEPIFTMREDQGSSLLQRKSFFNEITNWPRFIDLAPSDFRLFPGLNNDPGGKNFQTNDELQFTVQSHLTLLVTSFEEGNQKSRPLIWKIPQSSERLCIKATIFVHRIW